MKNTNSNITTQHTIHHGVFSPTIPELVEEFRRFVIMVNEYLCFQQDDVCYHASKTRGKSKHRKISISDGYWKFSGELVRENQPYTDTATFYYFNQKVWEMKRRITLSPSDTDSPEETSMEKILFCAVAAAKNYNPKIPWCGPRFYTDSRTELHYEAKYCSNEGNDSFSIKESISDAKGKILWAAVCEGGYV